MIIRETFDTNKLTFALFTFSQGPERFLNVKFDLDWQTFVLGKIEMASIPKALGFVFHSAKKKSWIESSWKDQG